MTMLDKDYAMSIIDALIPKNMKTFPVSFIISIVFNGIIALYIVYYDKNINTLYFLINFFISTTIIIVLSLYLKEYNDVVVRGFMRSDFYKISIYFLVCFIIANSGQLSHENPRLTVFIFCLSGIVSSFLAMYIRSRNRL